MLSKELIRELASHRGEPVLTSFYLNVDGRRYPRPSDLGPKVEHLFRTARHEAARSGPECSRAVEGDLGRIQAWLSQGVERASVRGLAAFSCDAQGFFSTLALPSPLRDEVSLDTHPHVAQLVVALEAAAPFLVVLADREQARLLRVEAGVVNEVAGPTDEVPRQVDTDVELGSFAHLHEEAGRRHLRRVANEVANEARRWAVARIILGGPASDDLKHHLHDEDLRRVAGVIAVEMTAQRDEVATTAQALLAHLDRERQSELVGRLFDRTGAGTTVGLSPTLDALAARRVGVLVIGHSLKSGGVRCPACGYLSLEGEHCPRCGERTEATDIAEAALVDALAAGASVEFVDVPELDAIGGIGSIERY